MTVKPKKLQRLKLSHAAEHLIFAWMGGGVKRSLKLCRVILRVVQVRTREWCFFSRGPGAAIASETPSDLHCCWISIRNTAQLLAHLCTFTFYIIFSQSNTGSVDLQLYCVE